MKTRLFKGKNGKRRGFTVVELLVGVAIIGTLSSVVIQSTNEVRAKARDSQRIAHAKEINNAVILYYDEHGEYPPAGITTYIGETEIVFKTSYYYDINGFLWAYAWRHDEGGNTSLQTTLDSYFPAQLPIDPGPYGGYGYAVTLDGSHYELSILLETDHALTCRNKNYYSEIYGEFICDDEGLWKGSGGPESNANDRTYYISS